MAKSGDQQLRRQPRAGTVFPSQCVAENIRRFRMRERLSQDALGKSMQALGFKTWYANAVAQAELGGRKVTIDELLALALVFEVPPFALMLPQERGPERRALDLGGDRPVEAWMAQFWFTGKAHVYAAFEEDGNAVVARELTAAGMVDDGSGLPSETDIESLRRFQQEQAKRETGMRFWSIPT